MSTRKELQLSGAKQRKLAKVKADNEQSTVAIAQRLDRFSYTQNCMRKKSQNRRHCMAAVETLSSTSTFQEGE